MAVDRTKAQAKDDQTKTCLAWGPLRARASDHQDCPVVVSEASQVRPARRKELGKLPALCACECLTCQRAWWNKGRPMRQGGRIVTSSGQVIA